MSTGCEFNDDRLVRYAADGVEPGERADVDRHLAACEACRAELAVISALRSAPPRPPLGLEARIRQAAWEELAASAESTAEPAHAATPHAGRRAGRGGGRRRRLAERWTPWVLPLAAAAAVAALWLGVEGPWSGGTGEAEVVLAESYEPYGAWPAADGMVAGDPVLSDLTVEDLERLLEEMR